MPATLDPQVAAVIEEIHSMGVPGWHAMSVESARRVEDEVFSEGSGEPPVETVRNLAFDSPDGDVQIRIYSPESEDPAPVIVFYHGGGWVLGTLDGVDDICRELATRISAVVVSVDYRLAPEHPFPEPLEDAYAAVEWANEHVAAFGGDTERVGVAGTSAGGNLAAATALLAQERDGPELAGQLLLYPVTNHAFDTDSYEANSSGYLLTRADMKWFWDHYLRNDVDGHNPFASPLRSSDLSGLPPATVVTAGFDPLRDEGAAYAEKLADAGVAVEHLDYERLCHGFLSMTDAVDAAEEAMDDVATSFEKWL